MSLTFSDENKLLRQERIEQPPTHSVSSISNSSKEPVNVHCKNVGLSGRLKKGAGTYLASWLQNLVSSYQMYPKKRFMNGFCPNQIHKLKQYYRCYKTCRHQKSRS